MAEHFRPSLAVHVVWHPDCSAGAEYAGALFAHLFEDRAALSAHGLRIPVRQWTSEVDGPDAPPPAVPPLAAAKRNAIVVVLDTSFVRRPSWLTLLDDIDAARGEQDVLLGVSLTPSALRIDSSALENNLIRLHEVTEDVRRPVLLNRVTHALCRLAADGQRPVKVFFSHAKHDGVPITRRVRDFLQDGSGVDNFFDTQGILEGARWQDVIRGAAAENVLLAIRTDAYATREWCRTEVLEAKRGGSPVVVLDALQTIESRSFPYLGNAPSVRWRKGASRKSMEELLSVVLSEVLRFRHFPNRVSDVCGAYGLPTHDRLLPAPPELLTVLRVRDGDADLPVVYPDPPLGTDELALLYELAPGLELTTPTRLIARR